MALIPRNTTEFSVLRNNNLVSKYSGLKDNSSPTKIIRFFNHVDIKANDILQDDATNVKYLVQDIKAFHKMGAGYGNSSPKNVVVSVKIVNSTINIPQNPLNITATNSIIAVNSQNVSGSINVTDIENLTQNCDEEDREIAKELIATLKELVNAQKPLKRGALSKFGDFLTKYTPVATGVAQLLLSIFV